MYIKFGKRTIDIILALIALPFAAIIFIIIAPIIHFHDKGPVFFIADRMGKNGHIFRMYKLRSMVVNAPNLKNKDGSTYNSENDPRVTRIGRFMRKTSIDELPQLINVLKGDMSFVGPRPTLAGRKFDTFDEIRRKRVSVRPGITGYSQAYFRNSITSDEKFENDCYYVDNISFILDIKIIFKTGISVLMRQNIYVEKSNVIIPENTSVLEFERTEVSDEVSVN